MGRRRRTSRRLAILGLLPWATVAHAVALSDFTPVLTNLTPTCQAAYTTTIPGCKVSDFTNAAHTCSSSCLNGLVQINALVNQDCADDEVDETSIIGLFLLGQAIQLLCNVAVVTTTTGVTGYGGGAIPTNTMSFQSTMTLSMTSLITSGVTTATSNASIASQASSTSSLTSISRPLPSASDGMIGNTPIAPTTSSTLFTSSTSKKSSETSLSPAAEESQRSGNIGSGGGSPFDNIDNSLATSMRTLDRFSGCVLLAVALTGLMMVW